MSKTKIVATLGPSTADPKVLAAMLKNGMSIARLNFSHGSYESHAELVAALRAASQATKIPVAIMQDLSGPKIRIGDFSTEEVTLKPKQSFTLSTERVEGTVERVSVTYKKLPKEVTAGNTIMLNDGKLELRVTGTTDTEVYTTVVVGGTIKGRRGVNVPDADLSIPALTEKDKKDVVFGLKLDVDFVTLSFVRSAEDIRDLRKALGVKAKKVGIIAKIETRGAVEHLEEIVAESDAVLVARGDLAIEIPREEVPVVQKRIILAANRAGKPVITATQMLDSMRENPVPTRAEVSDIANTIFDGTDAIMLSDETAVGNHPALAIAMMQKVARATEHSTLYREDHTNWKFTATTQVEAVSRAVVKTAETIHAEAIVAFSESGHTSRMVARYRPNLPVIVLTPNERTFNQSLLTFGCIPHIVPVCHRTKEALAVTRKTLLGRKLVKKGDTVVIGAGLPFGKPGGTNMMLVERV